MAQVYNFPVNDPRLFSFWFLGVLPLAYLTRSAAILALAIGLFLAATGFHIPNWLDGIGYGDRGEVIAATALFLNLGIMLFALGRFQAFHSLTRAYAQMYETLGLLTVLAAVYLLSFRFWFEDLGRGFHRLDVDIATGFWVLFYVSAVAGVTLFAASIAIQLRRQRTLMTLPYEAAAGLLMLIGAFLLSYLEVGSDVFYPIVFNALLLLSIVGLVFGGYFRERGQWVNVALVFFGLGVISRYFEFGWSLLDRSLVFIVAGIILLVGGFFLEQGRRKMFRRMGAQGGYHVP